MLWMHIAVTIALLGFLFPGFMAIKEWVAARSAPLAHPAAVQEQAVMSVSVPHLNGALCTQLHCGPAFAYCVGRFLRMNQSS